LAKSTRGTPTKKRAAPARGASAARTTRALGPITNYACTALKVGVGETGDVSIFLRERGGASFGDGRWFLAGPTVRREMLATALAAISTNLRLEAALESTNEFTTLAALAIARD